MFEQSVIGIIQNYLKQVAGAGIPVDGAVLYGSYARGEQTADSDIDLIVLSPLYDQDQTHQFDSPLWRLRCITDSRIEPIAAGVIEWKTNRSSPLLAIARREGIMIPRE